MTLVVPDEGEAELLERMLNTTTGATVLRLYTNSLTPVEGSVVADFTDATAAGYSPITLAEGSWTVSTTTGVTDAEFAQQTFTFTALETVEGYFVTNVGDTKVLWAEKFAAPANVPSGGGTIKITPKIEAA